MTFTFLTCSVV